MRKNKLFLLMACMVLTMSACQSKDTKQEETSTPVVKENTEETDMAEDGTESDDSIEESKDDSASQYEGLTIEEIENLGFEICGYGSSSSFGSKYSIQFTARKDNYVDLTFTIAELDKEENEKLSSEKDAAFDSTEYVYNYITENYPDNTSSNCSINYDVYGYDTLLQAYEDGVYIRCEDMENRTIEELCGDSYEFEGKQGSSLGVGDDAQHDYLVTLKNGEEEYIVVLEDIGNRALGELEFGASDEEAVDAIKDATVVEAYRLNDN